MYSLLGDLRRCAVTTSKVEDRTGCSWWSLGLSSKDLGEVWVLITAGRCWFYAGHLTTLRIMRLFGARYFWIKWEMFQQFLFQKAGMYMKNMKYNAVKSNVLCWSGVLKRLGFRLWVITRCPLRRWLRESLLGASWQLGWVLGRGAGGFDGEWISGQFNRVFLMKPPPNNNSNKKQTNKQTNKQASKQTSKQTNKKQTKNKQTN